MRGISRGDAREELEGRAGRARRPSSTGVKAPATAGRALSRTGISMKRAAGPLRLAHRQLERDVGAERGPSHDRRPSSEVVEQRRRPGGRRAASSRAAGPRAGPSARGRAGRRRSPGCPARPVPAPAARTCAGSSAARGRAPAPARPPHRSRTDPVSLVAELAHTGNLYTTRSPDSPEVQRFSALSGHQCVAPPG